MMYPVLGEQLKKELMDILACPICKGDLVLNITEKDEVEIKSGTLYCSQCREYYPVEDGIPNLLPPDIRE
jgi:uncharacterized protein YbaR (Trm112 family)